ncbi:MAG: carboxypeptidase-like regulatory domain-containing protein [Tenuifilaceae bacterium]|jgi:hypothetical protein|nr:carboxypeptidase-like regulatory domain-containing protein [Tenuifilaceae bacterium]
MRTLLLILTITALSGINSYAQTISGTLINKSSNLPVAYANIGIVGKNIGTVSDADGNFRLDIDSNYNNDSLLVSVIGYMTKAFKVSDLRNANNNTIFLKERIYSLNEVIVRPTVFKEKTLGVSTKIKRLQAGFSDNRLGYECGIMMKTKGNAHLKKIIVNIARCSYDTIFYRLNIYNVKGDFDFENILTDPIYIKMAKKDVKQRIELDLQDKNIVTSGSFLVTLEHVKDLGPGDLFFCASFLHKTYYRKTSQGQWESIPFGVSISVVADIEK